jgi:hypothetical protein
LSGGILDLQCAIELNGDTTGCQLVMRERAYPSLVIALPAIGKNAVTHLRNGCVDVDSVH